MELNVHSFRKSFENDGNINPQNLLNFQNHLESSLKLSEIGNKENEQTKQFDSINSYDLESIIHYNRTRNRNSKVINMKKKLTKEDLNNIPIPIFSCIFCSNDKIAFNHLINEILWDKYYVMSSIYDIQLIDKLVKTNPIMDNYNKNPPLINVIIKSTDFIKKHYNRKEIHNFFKSDKFRKKIEFNINCSNKCFKKKLESQLRMKKNKELSSNKNVTDYKSLFHKQNNNNSTFTNDNLTTNKNSINNTIGTGSFPNIGLSSSLNNNNNENKNNINNNNNLNIGLNQNNIMESIMEKIEKNEESECESEEKFLNILENKNNITNKMSKIKVSFENKFYDIWNPEITLVSEEKDEIQIKNQLTERNTKYIKSLIYNKNKRIKRCRINDDNNLVVKNNQGNNIISYNSEKNDKKINYKKIFFSPFLNNNLKKRNLMDFIKYKNKRNFHVDPLLLKEKFFTKDQNKTNKSNLDLINNLLTTKSRDSYNNTVSHLRTKNSSKISNLLKSKSGFIIDKKKDNNINSKKFMTSSTLSSKNNNSHIQKKTNFTLSNFFPSSSKIVKYKSFNKIKDLNKKNNCDIYLNIDINNKMIDILKKYLPRTNRFTNRSSLCCSLRDKNSLTSLPKINLNMSPIYNYKYKNTLIKINQNKKLQITNSNRKISSKNIILNNQCVSLYKPSIKLGTFSVK